MSAGRGRMRRVRAYAGVTDGDWYRYLSARRDRGQLPAAQRRTRFAAVEPGAPFLFKTHYGDELSNRIVGAGYLSGWAPLTVSRAWEFFGPDNGCATESEMRARIARFRRGSDLVADPEVGCIMLRDVRFFTPDQALPAPPDWSANIVQGKSYELAEESSSYIEHLLTALLAAHGVTETPLDALPGPGTVPGQVYGQPRLVPVRVGQQAFRRSSRRPADGAARSPATRSSLCCRPHIRPVTHAGENRVDNELLPRSDVHTLFDRGYLAVHPEKKTLLVSPRLRPDWGNGEEFYQREATHQPITLPSLATDRPHPEFLQLHPDTIYPSA